ncbi:unnamed protein product [Thelazia callipaeda]|uniref:ZP domain-containing protein n=1 Tax=Thelazia callipaeda TaxID=103827 RepID=A0A0N5CT80_THECL|nr:unnamed protein product [Thelazia callipaeda]
MLIIAIVVSIILYQSHGISLNLSGKKQCVGAVGQVVCSGQPSPYVFVALYNEDRNAYFNTNDIVRYVYTNETGHFAIFGCVSKEPAIVPKLHIYHRCHDESVICPLYLEIYIPYRHVKTMYTYTDEIDLAKINGSIHFMDIVDVTYRSGMEHTSCARFFVSDTFMIFKL